MESMIAEMERAAGTGNVRLAFERLAPILRILMEQRSGCMCKPAEAVSPVAAPAQEAEIVPAPKQDTVLPVPKQDVVPPAPKPVAAKPVQKPPVLRVAPKKK